VTWRQSKTDRKVLDYCAWVKPDGRDAWVPATKEFYRLDTDRRLVVELIAFGLLPTTPARFDTHCRAARSSRSRRAGKRISSFPRTGDGLHAVPGLRRERTGDPRCLNLANAGQATSFWRCCSRLWVLPLAAGAGGACPGYVTELVDRAQLGGVEAFGQDSERIWYKILDGPAVRK
jgi:hypothetical protein